MLTTDGSGLWGWLAGFGIGHLTPLGLWLRIAFGLAASIISYPIFKSYFEGLIYRRQLDAMTADLVRRQEILDKSISGK